MIRAQNPGGHFTKEKNNPRARKRTDSQARSGERGAVPGPDRKKVHVKADPGGR